MNVDAYVDQIKADHERLMAEIRAKEHANGHHPDIEIPPFPIDAIPEPVRGFIERASRAFPVPHEMLAVPFMVNTGALIGNRACLALKEMWVEYPTLWAVIIAESGRLKSPPLRLARSPLTDMQHEESLRYLFALASYEREMAERKRKKGEYLGEEPEEPKFRDYYTTDITMEALAAALHNSPGVLISIDELAGWVERMNQYRKGGDRQHYMSIHSGEAIKVNRKSQGVLEIPRPVIGVCGTIQPAIVTALRGAVRHEDGFVYRMLPVLPVLPPKKWNTHDINPNDREILASFFKAVDSAPIGSIASIRFSPEAEAVWGEWADENNEEAHRIAGVVGGFYSKLEAQVARIALILHVMGDPLLVSRELSADTMRDAIEIGEWFRPQIHEFIRLLQIGETSAADSRSAALWHRIVRAFRKLSGCQSCQMSDPHFASDNCFVSTRDIQRRLTITKEQLMNELDTYYDHIEIRHLTAGGRDQTLIRVVSEKSRDLTSDSTDNSDNSGDEPPW